MYYQLPLEQIVRHRNRPSQGDFAHEALAVLEETEDSRFEPTARGLALYGAHEEALAPPVAILRDRYHEALEVRPLRVRCLAGRPVRQPVMAVRVVARREHSLAVLAELRRRHARIEEECLRGRTFIVRAEAPLRDLLGLGESLEALTGGSAQHGMRLSRYLP